MIVQIKRQHEQRGNYFDLRQKIEFEKESNEVKSIVNHHFGDMVEAFRNEFGTHENLYRLINEKYLDRKYQPDGRHFNYGNAGFRQFVEDLSKREIRTLADVYTNMIMSKVEHIEKLKNEELTERISINPMDNVRKKETQLEDVDIRMPSMMVAGDKVYEVSMKEVDGILSVDDIKKEVYDTINNDFRAQVKTIKNSFKRKEEKLQQKFEQEKNELLTIVMKNADEIFKHWDVVDNDGTKYLQYKDKIVTDKIVHHNQLYDYPGEPKFREMFVTGLRVRITPIVSAGDIQCDNCFNAHFDNPKHVCMGQLSGKSLFEVLRELPRSLEIANMDSPLSSSVQNYLNDEFLRKSGEKRKNKIKDW